MLPLRRSRSPDDRVQPAAICRRRCRESHGLLKRAQELTHKIHLAVSDDNKRLKNAEILLRHTAFRLTEMLHASASEDRPLVQETLARVNAAQTEAMLQVFRK